MSLFTPPTPRTFTTAEIANARAVQLRQNAVNVGNLSAKDLNTILNDWTSAIKTIWDCKDFQGNTQSPQDAIAAYGTGAVNAFAASTATANFIVVMAPLVFPDYQSVDILSQVQTTLALVKPYTSNPDGSITIN